MMSGQTCRKEAWSVGEFVGTAGMSSSHFLKCQEESFK